MSLSSNIAPHLPYLRRFSRALSGNQTSGDAYVATLLEAIIAAPDKFQTDPNIKISLYGNFCKIWGSVAHNWKDSFTESPWEAKAQYHLSNLAPYARMAFLLKAVEGFSLTEIAGVLGKTNAEVEGLLEEASLTIINQVATDVMIIEDEPIIAIDLEAILETLGHRVVGVARTEQEALHLASHCKPGLILADIQLADGSSGIDAVNQILLNTSVPVIFITAYPERLLTGAKPEPPFLITKPFSPDMVKALVSQALFFNTAAKQAA